jgi:hypothetical protein
MPVRTVLQVHAARARLDESMSLFKERCKSAGEKITRTVDNVEGVVWMKWRESSDKTIGFEVSRYFRADVAASMIALATSVGLES